MNFTPMDFVMSYVFPVAFGVVLGAAAMLAVVGALILMLRLMDDYL